MARGLAWQEKERKGQAMQFLRAAEIGTVTGVVALLDGPEPPAIDGRDAYGWTAALWAAWRGHDKVLEALAQRGANLDARSNDGVTPLMAAAGEGHRGAVELLLDRGVSVKSRGGADGNTALMEAAKGGHEEVVKLLLARGANVYTRNNAYHTAQSLATAAPVKALLKVGANVLPRGGHEGFGGLESELFDALCGRTPSSPSPCGSPPRNATRPR
jgi:uncharacterized protein